MPEPEIAVVEVRLSRWRRALVRLALAAFQLGGWLARRAGLGVTLAIHQDPPRCIHGRTIGNGYTCKPCDS